MIETPADRIRVAIADHGPITFAEFMEHALYGPGGFYEQPPVGEEGHFVTSPHVHPVFADLLRFALGDLRSGLGDPDPFPIVELGAGDGTLALQLLEGARQAGTPPFAYEALERSSGARKRLRELDLRVGERIEGTPLADGVCVFANELLDNLPFRRIRGGDDGPVEVRVGLAGDGFQEVEAPCDDELLASAPARPDRDDEIIVPVEALRLVNDLAGRLQRGYVFFIDYGSEGPRASGTVHGYRSHRMHADVLTKPGTADITAGVDFGTIAHRAEQRGLESLGLVTQRDALLALGFEGWNEGQLRRQTDALQTGRSREAVGAWESRGVAGILIDPAGLGALRWLLLATPGLPAPSWISAPGTRSGPASTGGTRST
ncbi:MAG: SAM-dependent methyltransferase [Actinomycetota bacterium]